MDAGGGKGDAQEKIAKGGCNLTPGDVPRLETIAVARRRNGPQGSALTERAPWWNLSCVPSFPSCTWERSCPRNFVASVL